MGGSSSVRDQRALTTASEAVPLSTVLDLPANRRWEVANYIARGVFDEIEDDARIWQCMECDWIGVEPEDGICPGCGIPLSH
jgi:hypothetical protein